MDHNSSLTEQSNSTNTDASTQQATEQTPVADAPKPPKKRYLASSASQLAQEPPSSSQLHHSKLPLAIASSISSSSLSSSSSSSPSSNLSICMDSSEISAKNKTGTASVNSNNNCNSRHKHTITTKSVDCAISILDPLIFDQDTLERIIEHALSDKTNLTSKTTPSIIDSRQHHSTLSMFSNKTSHFTDNNHQNNLDNPNNNNSKQITSLETDPPIRDHPPMQCQASFTDSPPSLISLQQHYNHSHFSATSSQSIASQQSKHRSDILASISQVHNSNKSSLIDKWNMENDLKHTQQRDNMKIDDGDEQEKPMDFSVNKTYEQTGQNIINHVIDKMMGQTNDGSILMLSA